MKTAILSAMLTFVFGTTAFAANPIVVIDTSMGPIKVELFEDKAPATVQNFLNYVSDKHYDGTIFHRVMGKPHSERDFMIQGGGFGADRKEKPTKPPIENESTNGLSNTRGTIAMARTNAPNSAAAQFYINVADNTFLDRANAKDRVGYCVFGKVIEGLDVVDKIKEVKIGEATLETKNGPDRTNTVPVDPVTIKSVKRMEK